jgi:hypothetical protein
MTARESPRPPLRGGARKAINPHREGASRPGRAAVPSVREVDPHDLLHPLHNSLEVVWGARRAAPAVPDSGAGREPWRSWRGSQRVGYTCRREITHATGSGG